jgi:hypothetical protein
MEVAYDRSDSDSDMSDSESSDTEMETSSSESGLESDLESDSESSPPSKTVKPEEQRYVINSHSSTIHPSPGRYEFSVDTVNDDEIQCVLTTRACSQRDYLRLPARRVKVEKRVIKVPDEVVLFREECIQLSKFIITARDEMSASPAEGLHLRFEKLDGSEKRRQDSTGSTSFYTFPEIVIDYKTKSITITTFGVEYDGVNPSDEWIFTLGQVKLNHGQIKSLCHSLDGIDREIRRAEKLNEMWAKVEAELAKYPPTHEFNTYCPICGETDETKLVRLGAIPDCYGAATVFCMKGDSKGYGDCFDKYRLHIMGRMTNLEHGIPALWINESFNPNKFCSVPEREEGVDLICDFCGTKNSNIISHPRMPKKYNATNFCMNNTCCSSYITYVDNPPRIPFKIQQESKIVTCG